MIYRSVNPHVPLVYHSLLLVTLPQINDILENNVSATSIMLIIAINVIAAVMYANMIQCSMLEEKARINANVWNEIDTTKYATLFISGIYYYLLISA